ncbi:MAG: hypothetical protein LBT44_05140 [Clostridiales bacterium]|nr:hypothetical protein [Clostridiales bacterium]
MMNEFLFESTKTAAYFLWETTKCDNTLTLWNCAEDIACFLEQSDILSPARITIILGTGVYDMGYISFVRHIAYRIYIYTGREDSLKNWFDAEALLNNIEWRQAITRMAYIYNRDKHKADGLSALHCDLIKNFYEGENGKF